MEPLKRSAPARTVLCASMACAALFAPTGEAEGTDGFHVGGQHRCPVTNWYPLASEADQGRGAFGALQPTSPPCWYPGTTACANIYKARTDFIERFDAEAVRLGWTTLLNYGAHPRHGTLRVDWCGVTITGGHKAIGK